MAARREGLGDGGGGEEDGGEARKKYLKNMRNTNFGPISFFVCFHIFYQNWYNGLDLNRFCAPEHIIEMSNSLIC